MTTKNTFRKHTAKKAKKNLDLLNVRHCQIGKVNNGIYELTDIVEPAENPLLKYVSEERLIGMCIGLGIALIPLMALNIWVWANALR